MSEKFPYLARQINGPIANSFGKGIDSVYENDSDFIDYIANFSINNFDGDWLDMLGKIVGLPRPWLETPVIQEAFLFDDSPSILPNPDTHGFSTDRTVVIDGTTVTPSMGGKLDDTNRTEGVSPISDTVYKDYLKCACLVKKTHSINGIADVIEVFSSSKQYSISFISDESWLNDVLVKISLRLMNYQETLQNAFDNIFTTAPRVLIRIDTNFDNEYIIPEVKTVVSGIVGNNNFTVSCISKGFTLLISVVLDKSNESYKDVVSEALTTEYKDYSDIQINVTVAE